MIDSPRPFRSWSARPLEPMDIETYDILQRRWEANEPTFRGTHRLQKAATARPDHHRVFITRLEHLDATEIGFLRASLENARHEIKDGYRCMKSGSNLLRAAVEYEVEHGMSPLVGFV